ncbi:hypothetical protein C6P41_001598 [Kluyveromyces marxianus]|nr:hypothetical protein C6P43_002419 [Kluyveromyces marxianus]KAG0684859.1 hypothetical protein C6P41_001598 [Kluyveromyces marxianus]
MSRSKSGLKRSTVILDDNMVRDSMLSRDNSIMDLLLIDEDESEFLEGEETSEVVFLSKGQSQLDFHLDLWENDTAVLSRTPLEF